MQTEYDILEHLLKDRKRIVEYIRQYINNPLTLEQKDFHPQTDFNKVIYDLLCDYLVGHFNLSYIQVCDIMSDSDLLSKIDFKDLYLDRSFYYGFVN